MKHRAEIDGLRTIAVVPVVLFHAGLSMFKGGFVGVDIFFVISGFLITSILLTELKEDRFSILKFYERRARRILPALGVVMLSTIPFAWLWMVPSQFKDFSESLIAVSLFVSNILFWKESGYFEAAVEEKPLLHTWSLAVEEQYYVLFPIALALAWRLGRRPAFVLVAAAAAGSLLLAELGWRHFPTANFYLAPTRFWELLIGSLSAFIASGRPLAKSNIISASGLFLVLISIFLFNKDTPFPSIYSVVPTVGTALIILYGSSGTWVASILSLRPLVGIGLISYSAYLWHQPLFAFARIRAADAPPQWLMSCLALLTFALAYLTWKWVEQPFRKRLVVPSPIVVASASVLAVVFAAIGSAGTFSNGREAYWVSTRKENVQQAYFKLREAQRLGNYRQDVNECVFNARTLNKDSIRRIEACYKKYGSGYAILGDSHAVDLFGVAASANPREKFLVGLAGGGCRPHTASPGCDYEELPQFLATHPGVFTKIIYEQAGFYLLRTKEDSVGTRRLFTEKSLSSQISGVYPNQVFILSVADYLKKLSKYADVVWFTPRIEHHIPIDIILRRGCGAKYSIRPGQKEIFSSLDRAIFASINGSGVRAISQNESFRFDFTHDLLDCDSMYWTDGDHFSKSGEIRFGDRYNVLTETSSIRPHAWTMHSDGF